MRFARLCLVIGLLALAALPARGQGTLCQIELEEAAAVLMRAQAAAGRGDLPIALGYIERADARLAAIVGRCDLPAVEITLDLEAVYTALNNSFSLRYPAGWVVGGESADAAGGGVVIGSDAASASALETAQPVLEPGAQGVLIAYGTPDALAGGLNILDTLEAVAGYYEALIAAQFIVRGDLNYVLLGGRPAARFDFTGGSFDGTLIVVEVIPGERYAVVAASAAPGELSAQRPLFEAIAASIQAEG